MSWSLDDNNEAITQSPVSTTDEYEYDNNEEVTYEWLESQTSSKQELVRSIHDQFIENLNKERIQRDRSKLVDITKLCVRDLWRWIEENALDAISENKQYCELNQMLRNRNRELQHQHERILCELEQYKQHSADLQHQASDYMAENMELKNAFNAMTDQTASAMHEFERNQDLMEQMTIKVGKLKEELAATYEKLQRFETDNLRLIQSNDNLQNEKEEIEKRHQIAIGIIKNEHQKVQKIIVFVRSKPFLVHIS